MKKIFFILCICLSFNCFAQQEWAPIGAKWYYSFWCMEPDLGCAYYTFESVRDTFLLGKNARVLEYAINGQVDPAGMQIMYGDSDKVYHYFDGEFYTLYDFSALPGDTLTIKIGPFAAYSSYAAPDSGGWFREIVDSVGTTIIDGQTLRILYSHPGSYDTIDLANGYVEWIYWGQIIENIGNISSMFGHNYSFILAGYEGWIRCYQDSVLFYKPFANNCDYISGINDKGFVDGFNIYPNPACDFINIEMRTENIKNKKIDFKIFDVLGRIASENKLIGKSNHINISNLNDGIYLILININKEKTMTLFMKHSL